jgi:hypothetical protein
LLTIASELIRNEEAVARAIVLSEPELSEWEEEEEEEEQEEESPKLVQPQEGIVFEFNYGLVERQLR